MTVKKLDSQYYFSKKKLSISELETWVFLQIVKKFTTCAQVNHQAKVISGDKCIVELDQERIFELF